MVQPLVPRILGLAELRLEVAGGSSTEAPLAYLSLPAAHALRAQMLALHARPPESEAAAPGPMDPSQVLAQVPVSQLVGSALRPAPGRLRWSSPDWRSSTSC